jgi:hypothetical protein
MICVSTSSTLVGKATDELVGSVNNRYFGPVYRLPSIPQCEVGSLFYDAVSVTRLCSVDARVTSEL